MVAGASAVDPIKSAVSRTLRALEFGFCHALLAVVDRVVRFPRNTTMPEAARLYRETHPSCAGTDVGARRAGLRWLPHARERAVP